ncbi:MAG TPA: uroporphyrinogen-III C-methyltransferase [Burkholderiales bacterium]|jgi:uroporphyrin-III C-methyltransferase|nr:uroporphyrinogen-III C-methyltransferase [Burkholderiales bacterium]
MGKVYLVGAGPGAPDLLTLRAAEILKRADIVFHDALVHRQTLSLAGRARKILVGKRSGRRSTAQAFINKRLIDAAGSCGVVVRLKGGDPTLFGRAQEEVDALRKAGVDFEIIPGVTAATAAAAELGMSLTRRGIARHVVFVTPRAAEGERENDWAASVLAADTAVIYMGAGLAEAISTELINRGKPKDTPLVLVESATLPERCVLHGTLADLPKLARRSGSGPATVLLGEVLKAALADSPVVSIPEIQAHLRRA